MRYLLENQNFHKQINLPRYRIQNHVSRTFSDFPTYQTAPPTSQSIDNLLFLRGDSVKMSDNERVMEWEHGLPNADDLTPLSQTLIPIELMSAFSISPEACRTVHEVNRASQNTLSSIRGNSNSFSSYNSKSLNEEKNRDSFVIEEDDPIGDGDESEARKIRRIDSHEETDSALRMEDSMDDHHHSNRTSKRHRLVWTPLLHQRFVEVVARLGIKNAVPKTIMQCMNVEGLTRENVASHLQKYRLYLKRNDGSPNEDPSSSDALIESTPVPQSLHEPTGGNSHGHMPMQIQMQYPPAMMHMPGYGTGHGHMRMPFGNPNAGQYRGFESHPYNMSQQRDWSLYPHVAPSEK